MATSRNHKSLTLPSGLRHSTQQPEDSGGFFAKLRKKLKFKKGKYPVNVNTGECENVSALSFKKRQSTEVVGVSSWEKCEAHSRKESLRETRSVSPHQPKRATFKTQSDLHLGSHKSKAKHERKHSYPENQLAALKASEQRESDSLSSSVSVNSSRVKNEYSKLDYETRDLASERHERFKAEVPVHNETLAQDDSAIDLDLVDVKAESGTSEPAVPPDFGLVDPGYERLPVRPSPISRNVDSPSGGQKSPDWDPRYESMEEVKAKMNKQFPKTSPNAVGAVDRNSDSSAGVAASFSADSDMNRLDDPGYQSVKDVKPAKKYSLNQSIESLDEPGYESLDAVKKKIQESRAANQHQNNAIQEKAEDMNDSALGMTPSVGRNLNSAVAPGDDCENQGQHEVSQCSGNETCVQGLTEEAVNLSNVAIAVSQSIGANHEPNYGPADVSSRNTAEDLYSTVRKPVLVLAPETAENSDNHGADQPEGYDSDMDLILDPGYAECADAIKGCIQFGIYSDGSGSKISSCTSLDLSAEDFAVEPGYAECADAIKTGAIKKISVSQEHLFDKSVGKSDDGRELVSEIYANPQILFRKRSQLLEQDSFPTDSSQAEKHIISSGGVQTSHGQRTIEKKSSKVKSKKKGKEAKTVPSVAPPLPARNYSLHLEGEEADEEVKDLPTKLDEEADGVFGSLGDIESERKEAVLISRENDHAGGEIHELKMCVSENDKLDCDSEKASKCAISEGSDTNCAASNCAIEGSESLTADKCCPNEDACLHFTVLGTHGDQYTLTIIDRDESLQTVGRRKGNREKRRVDKERCSVESQNQAESSGREACCDDGLNCGSGDSSESEATCSCENKPCSSVHCTKDFSKQFDGSCDSCVNGESSLVCKEKACVENSVTDTQNVGPSLSDVILTVECQSGEFAHSEEDDISSLNPDYLLTVNAIKMKSVSSLDSDCEFTEDLPKLEIRESDLDSPFDSDQSNTSVNLDIASESSVIAQLTDDLATEFEGGSLCKSDVQGNVFEGNQPQLTDLLCMSVQTSLASVNNFSATKCVSESINEAPIQSTSAINPCENISANHIITKDLSLQTGVGTEKELPQSAQRKVSKVDHNDTNRSCRETQIPESVVSEDSAIEDNDEPDPLPQSVCDPTSDTETETQSCRASSSASQPLVYKHLDPMLFVDTEPTHMSLEEVMSPHAGAATVFKEESDTEDGHHHEDKVDGKLTPRDSRPPRPPPVTGRHRNTNASVTPTEENLPGFRLCETDEQAAPPIPPRSSKRSSTRRPVSYSQDFMESMRQLKDVGWYWGPLSWEEAELKLANKPEGTFLVRDSSDERYILSLSFKNMGRVHHTRIEHHKGHFSFWSQPDSHGKSTIKEFIEQCVDNSRNGRFLYFIRPSGPGSPPMPIHLLHPVSRFVQMRSLQHMCRFTIIQLVRRDHIDQLPVPTRIKEYLKQAQYYVEYLED